MTYDYLIVGAGLFGATFAQQATEAGKRCLVIDRRPHIAGNCYTEDQDGITVHMYGPHLFHTSSERIWRYVNRFAEWNGYRHTVQASTMRGVLSLPISLHTLNTLAGVSSPSQARAYFDRHAVKDAAGDNVESWCLRNIGRELYELLIRDYTIKQWGRHPSTLPSSIVKRLPIRLTWDNRYFSDRYEGVPVGGYTQMVEKMLAEADVILDVDFHADRAGWRRLARRVVYSGPIDELFGWDQGRLAYRSIQIAHERHETNDYQGIGQLNYPRPDVPQTRIVEPKHFVPGLRLSHTIVSVERTSDRGEPAYPIADAENTALAVAYQQRAAAEGYIVGGRLGKYQYLDMHQAIGMALKTAEEELRA